MAPDAVEPIPEPVPPPRPAGGLLQGVSVLVVDDDADTREVMRAIFEAAGARVHLAASAREALRRFVLLRPTVLLVDLAMPGEDGLWLIARVRALAMERLRPTPAVALAAFGARGRRDAAVAAGFQAVVAKPFGPEELLRAVAGLVAPARRAPA